MKNYTPRAFFRQMPNALLARYFESRLLLSNLDFQTLSDTKPDELMAAWTALPPAEREAAESELRSIFDLCSPSGFRAILDEAAWHLRDESAALRVLTDRLAGLGSDYERAMVAFLDHPELWRGATQFHHADCLSRWRKRKNFPCVEPAVDPASCDELARRISTYFRFEEGRGRNCIVECLRRGELDYFFAYPEDFSQESVEWVDGDFARRPHNPAFEVVMVYSRSDGWLDINYRGSRTAVPRLQEMFAQVILRQAGLPAEIPNSRVYDLNVLCDPNFEFIFDPIERIQRVVIKKVRVSSRVRPGERLTLEVNPRLGRRAFFESLERLRRTHPLEQYNVTQVDLAVTVAPEVGDRAKTVTVTLTHPDSCTAKYDEVGLKIRAMLIASGIEPREQEPDWETDSTAAEESA